MKTENSDNEQRQALGRVRRARPTADALTYHADPLGLAITAEIEAAYSVRQGHHWEAARWSRIARQARTEVEWRDVRHPIRKVVR